jgi:signal transduction histidine kinase/predicted hydrocarbon binding protein
MALYNHPLLTQGAPGELRFGGARMALMDIEAGLWGLRRQIETLVGPRLADNILQQAGANGGASFARALVDANGKRDAASALRECVAALEAAGFGTFRVEEIAWGGTRVVVSARDSAEAWLMTRHGQRPEGPACAYAAGVLTGFVNVLGDRRDIVCIERQCEALGADECRFELLPARDVVGPWAVVSFDPDPYLSHQLNLLEVLFDRMPVAISLWDTDLGLRRCNPTWVTFLERYLRVPPSKVTPGARLAGLMPDFGKAVLPLWEQALTGTTVRKSAVRREADGIVSYWDLAIGPIVVGGQVVGLLDVEADATERVLAYRELEQRIDERTREVKQRQEVAEGLRDILAVLNSERPLKEILSFISGAARRLLGAADVNIYLVGEHDVALARGACAPAAAFRAPAVQPDLLAVPLVGKEEVLGVVTLQYPGAHSFSPEEVDLAVTFADQAALAVENARLRERAERMAAAAERTRLARDLHDAVTQTLFSASLIAEVLPRVLEKDEAEGDRRLTELRQLTRGALAEMRTLLLELRPTTLVEAHLGDLLQQLGEAVQGRARIPVEVTVHGSGTLPQDVQIAFFRVAQEALNNAARHARAQHLAVRLSFAPAGGVCLTVADDGAGFEPHAQRPGHFGLGNMAERAASVGAALDVGSAPGKGTCITMRWAPQGVKGP